MGAVFVVCGCGLVCAVVVGGLVCGSYGRGDLVDCVVGGLVCGGWIGACVCGSRKRWSRRIQSQVLVYGWCINSK